MLDTRGQDAAHVAAPQERNVLAIFTVDRNRRVFVGLRSQRRAIFGLRGFELADQPGLFGLLRVGRFCDRVQVVQLFANFGQPQRLLD